MRTVARYDATLLSFSSISNSETRAHRRSRTVCAAMATAFLAASAKLVLDTATTSMIFWTIDDTIRPHSPPCLKESPSATSSIQIYTRVPHAIAHMAAAKKVAKKTKARRDFETWFRKELKKSVKENQEILEALD